MFRHEFFTETEKRYITAIVVKIFFAINKTWQKVCLRKKWQINEKKES